MQKQWLEAGRIVGTHGVRGELKLEPWTDTPDFLLDFDQIRLAGKCIAVEQSRVHKSQILLKLAGIDTVEAAAALRGQIVSINREDAHLEEGAVFIADLIGLPVYDEAHNELGKITEVLTLPANDVYVVKGTHEYMIPVVKEFVRNIDTASGITIHLVEGMQSDAN